MAGRGAALIVLAALAAATPVRADDEQSTAVSGVGVSLPKACIGPRDPPDLETPAPKLLSTYPAQGQIVRPGVLVLRVTFDLPMACSPQRSPGVMDTRPGEPCATDHVQYWLVHGRRVDWTVVCHVKPKTSYSFRLKNFKGLSGREAEPYTLTFDTSDQAPVLTERESQLQDPRFHLGAPPLAAE
jgi:hypothetical protein